MSEKYDNSGAIFLNDRKEKDTHPDRTGTATIAGVEYYVSGWLKQGKKGQFLSLAFKPKDDAQKAGMQSARKPLELPDDGFSDSIPF